MEAEGVPRTERGGVRVGQVRADPDGKEV